ncbi:fructosamine kinase family protein [soil metagenome]
MAASLPPSVADAIERQFGSVQSVSGLGGGCIANATRVKTKHADLFVKYADGESGATFEAEAAGLAALAQANEVADAPLVIPSVYAATNATPDAPGHLVLDFLETRSPAAGDWEALGRGLAMLHQANIDRPGRYGFHADNFIGRLPQHNQWRDDWVDFYRSQRLEPQARMAREGGAWQPRWNQPWGRLLDRLGEILPASPHGALLHGDLWSGNVMHTTRGPALVDPAAHFGDGESDLAMAALFGGFPGAFFDAFFDVIPKAPGASERRELYQLYHLINHLNHFGSGYARQVESVLMCLARKA